MPVLIHKHYKCILYGRCTQCVNNEADWLSTNLSRGVPCVTGHVPSHVMSCDQPSASADLSYQRVSLCSPCSLVASAVSPCLQRRGVWPEEGRGGERNGGTGGRGRERRKMGNEEE